MKQDKEVVVVLPLLGDRVLMQLRDIKPNIDAPGCWGFFGGALQPNESPQKGASRELLEETGLAPKILHPLGSEKISDLNNIFVYSFCCNLNKPLKKIRLREGIDFALVKLADIQEKRVFSKKMKRYFPVTPTSFVERTVRKALDFKTRDPSTF